MKSKLDIGEIGDNRWKWEKIGAKANLERLAPSKAGEGSTYFGRPCRMGSKEAKGRILGSITI